MTEEERKRVEEIVSEQMDFPPKDAERKVIDMSDLTVGMLGHAHIDLGYRWDFKETVHRVAPWTFAGVLDVMEKTPGFTFCQSQMYLYEAVQREYPVLFQKIISRIEKGNWEVIGGCWSEYDAVLPSGESIIRQYLVGNGYAKKHLGVSPHPVAFVPDSFIGHAETLPQILSGCGIKYYVFCRGLPKDPETGKAETRVFRWVGPDGSSVIAYRPVGNYSTPALTKEQLAQLAPYVALGTTKKELILYGTGDHGGGPRDEDIRALENLHTIPEAPSWEYTRADRFFEELEKEIEDEFGSGPETDSPSEYHGISEYRGTMEAFATGALTSQAQTKRNNRVCERRILQTEAVITAATFLQRKPCYPRVDFQTVWRDLLTLQFHDILPGTSVASVYRDAAMMYDNIKERTAAMIKDGIVRMSSRIDTRGDGCPLFICNPGTEELKTYVSVPYPDAITRLSDPKWASRTARRAGTEQKNIAFTLVGPNEEIVNTFFGDEYIQFPVELPPLGYALFHLKTDAQIAQKTTDTQKLMQSTPTSLHFNNGTVENRYFSVTLSPETGNITGIFDKNRSEELLDGECNVLELYRENELATSWVHVIEGAPQELTVERAVQVKEVTPFSITLASVATSKFSVFTREVTLYDDIPRIDCSLSIDWHESSAFLKLGFTPKLNKTDDNKPQVVTTLPYGTTAVNAPEREFAVQDWVDIHDDSRGLAVITDGSSGADVQEGRLRLSVIRNVRDMDPSMAHGPHELHYSLYPHSVEPGRALGIAEITAEAKRFLTDTYSLWDSEHPGGIMNWDHYSMDTSVPIKRTGSFIDIKSDTVFLEAVKMVDEEYTPAGIVIRLREVEGKKTSAEITFPFSPSKVIRADHLERPSEKEYPVEGSTAQIELGPYGLATIIARMDNPTML